MHVTLILICIVVVIFKVASSYKRCPKDKILVVYGRTGGTSAKCIHGGGAFIMPIFQDYAYLDLKPVEIEINSEVISKVLKKAINFGLRFKVSFSTENEQSMLMAAEKFLGLSYLEIQKIIFDLIIKQINIVLIPNKENEGDFDMILENVSKKIEAELKLLGIKLIRVRSFGFVGEKLIFDKIINI